MFKDERFKGLTTESLKRDFISGITVGIVAIPLGMAFAIASGVKPEYGLYTTVIAGIMVALFGGSRYQIAGPTGAFIPILLAIVLEYGYEDLLIAGLLAGIMLIMMGLFKLGGLIKFIPRPVTIGFTSGIAVIIFSGQIGDFLGLEGLEKKQYFHENMLELGNQLPTINMYSMLTASIGLLVLIIIPKIFPRIPVLLFALLVPTIIATIFFPEKVATIGSAFGGIPQALPSFQLPAITFDKIIQLWQPAFVIAMLGGIESLLSAVVSDGMTGKRHHSNRELVGQGIANVVTPFFGGIPATGAIARTATNIKAGAVSPVSGLVQGGFVFLTILLLAPYAASIPLASMAPILMVVSYNMSEMKSFLHIIKLKNSDSLVLVTTFLLTVFINLTVAVQFGLLMAAILFIKRMSEVLAVKEVIPSLTKENNIGEEAVEDSGNCSQLSFYTVAGPLFFGAADKFESIITRSINKRPQVLILKMKYVSLLDATGATNLSALVKDFKQIGGTILISEVNENVLPILKTSGIYSLIGEEHFFQRSTDAVDYALQRINIKKCSRCNRCSDNACQVFVPSNKIKQISS
ncbi:SulP family inorganic anion transporter [Virgibacillus sp. MG-45]|uniref:SulP family inorganic anion transporter n=1 Tax=Virgibacillus sp. MG-45 TaxID=3102791 RepID=UPI002EDB907F